MSTNIQELNKHSFMHYTNLLLLPKVLSTFEHLIRKQKAFKGGEV